MAIYFNTERNEYPRYIGDIQLEHPNFNEGDTLPQGWVFLEETDSPLVGENQYTKLTTPKYENDSYHMSWEIITLTDEEIKTVKINDLKFKMNNSNLSLDEIQFIVDNKKEF
jgi:hypothetical protein